MTYTYSIYTLIDISQNLNNNPEHKNQQRNLDTLEQVISLRCIPENIEYIQTTMPGVELNQLLHRSDLQSDVYNVWILTFENKDHIDEQAINNDLDNVPVIKNTSNSVKINDKMFKTYGNMANSMCVLKKIN